jgi:hypothetical protein
MRRLRDLHESGGESLWIITCIQTHIPLFSLWVLLFWSFLV